MSIPIICNPQTENEVGKVLANAISVQTEVANRAWLALMTAAAYTILPRQGEYISLPFGIGTVKAVLFHPVAFSILVIVALAFAAAQARHLDVQDFAHSVFDSLATETSAGQHKLFDITRKPSLLLVSPLAWTLKGCPRWRRTISVYYYNVLKAISRVVFLGLPITALYLEMLNANSAITAIKSIYHVILQILCTLGGLFAIGALIQVGCLEFTYARKSKRKLSGPSQQYLKKRNA